MSSVEGIPKTPSSSELEHKSTLKSRTNNNCSLLNSKPEKENNKRKVPQSSQVSNNSFQKRSKKQPTSSDNPNQIARSKTCTPDNNMIAPSSQPSHILCEEVWGSRVGAHSLPSLSQIARLRNRETCESVKQIQTSPYKYTVGCCLFDSAIFCLSRSKYFETTIRHTNGPRLRASLYEWALAALTTEGNGTLSDMSDIYIEK